VPRSLDMSLTVRTFRRRQRGAFLCQASAEGSIDPTVYRSDDSDYLFWKAHGEGGQRSTLISPAGADRAVTPFLRKCDPSWKERGMPFEHGDAVAGRQDSGVQ